MKKGRFSEEQIIGILKQLEAGQSGGPPTRARHQWAVAAAYRLHSDTLLAHPSANKADSIQPRDASKRLRSSNENFGQYHLSHWWH